MLEEDFTGTGGVRLHLRSWLPEGAPRGVVAICPGVNSHGGQYAWTAEELAARGFAVYAVDLRGRGSPRASGSTSRTSPSMSPTSAG